MYSLMTGSESHLDKQYKILSKIMYLLVAFDAFSVSKFPFSCTSSLSSDSSTVKSNPGTPISSLLHCLSSYW